MTLLLYFCYVLPLGNVIHMRNVIVNCVTWVRSGGVGCSGVGVPLPCDVAMGLWCHVVLLGSEVIDRP